MLVEFGSTELAISVVTAMHFIPAVIIAPFSGAIIDRFKIKPLMVSLLSIELIMTLCFLTIDNKNDIWTVYGVNSNFFKKITITIFNRFGKVLYTINNQNAEQGWNGTLNGKPLPPNDYWFYAKLVDLNDNIIEKKGHFSLQQNK